MESLSEDDLQDFIQDLEDDEIKVQANILKTLARYPAKEARLIPHLEKFLDDRRFILLCIPFAYGEMRYAAAHALAQTYKLLDIDKTVELKKVPIPMGANDYEVDSTIPDELTVKEIDPVLATCKEYEIIRDLGRIPMVDMTLKPGAYMVTEMYKEWGLPLGWKWSE